MNLNNTKQIHTEKQPKEDQCCSKLRLRFAYNSDGSDDEVDEGRWCHGRFEGCKRSGLVRSLYVLYAVVLMKELSLWCVSCRNLLGCRRLLRAQCCLVSRCFSLKFWGWVVVIGYEELMKVWFCCSNMRGLSRRKVCCSMRDWYVVIMFVVWENKGPNEWYLWLDRWQLRQIRRSYFCCSFLSKRDGEDEVIFVCSDEFERYECCVGNIYCQCERGRLRIDVVFCEVDVRYRKGVWRWLDVFSWCWDETEVEEDI